MDYFFKILHTPVGCLNLISDEFRLKSISFKDEVVLNEKDTIRQPVPEILENAISQLKEYFEGNRFVFNLDLDPEGTYFQQKVWKLIEGVHYGKTKSYGEIARELGSAESSRAVGLANSRNPLPIVIPCHRIIGINGKLTGYAGGLERKKWLLIHEQKYSRNSLF